ncbi:hypothetical protein O6H91_13G038300 [Diphasiastrum complanatum]|nr:hypothetical protein O6H91_13G038300 [Diphasiastrum complanatum]
MDINETIFLHSTIDPWAAQEQDKIKALLDIDFNGNETGKQHFQYNKAMQANMMTQRTALTHRSDEKKLPSQIFTPKYASHWSTFQSLLLAWASNKRHEPQVMRELLLLTKDPIDRHYNQTIDLRTAKPYRNCAVVGNSGILLDNTYGSFIDSHEMVMRLNNARIYGFKDSVGTKTTISFMNSNVLHSCSNRPRCYCHPYGENVPIVAYMCQVVHLMDVALCSSWHKAPLIVTDPRFDGLCMRIAKYYSLKTFFHSTGRSVDDWSRVHDGIMFHYSSGMQAVMVAVGMCEEVSIFGFGKSAHAKHHYHTNQRGELSLHDYEAEYAFYRDLVNGSISIPFLDQAGISLPRVHIFS